MKWLCTTAILLATGSGVAIAQQESDSHRKPEQRQSVSPREPSGPAASKQQTAAPSRNGEARQSPSEAAREPRRAEEGGSRDQVHQKADRERQSGRQAEEQGRAERRQPTTTGQNEQRGSKAREAERNQPINQERGQPTRQERGQAAEQERGQAASGRNARPGTRQSEQDQKERSRQAEQPRQPPDGDRNRQADTERNKQAAEPRETRNPQASKTGRPNDTARPAESERQNQTIGQTQERSERERTSATTVNQDQRRQVVDRLRRDRDFTRENQNVNVRVNVGERLPENVRPRQLPRDIVEIVPQYRDYDYTVIDNRVAIVDPRTREVVDVIDESGGERAYYADREYSSGRSRITFSSDERQLLRRHATSGGTVGLAGGGNSSCITLRPIPEELARQHPELASDKYLAIGDQIVVVDPRDQKIVQVID
jgi:hypothetical protein